MKIFYSIMVFATILERSNGFLHPKMSLTHVKDQTELKQMEGNKSCVVLVTGEGCRACMRFKNPFYKLSRDNENVDMYEITLNDISLGKALNKSIMRYASKNGVRTVPSILLHEGESVKMIPVNTKNLDVIEEIIRKM